MDKVSGWVERAGAAAVVLGGWLGALGAWSSPWIKRNVTFGLVLAVATEAPRWAFAFIGAHEPVWAGVAVAVLMAYAAAQGWDEFFRRRDGLLLSLNLGQIASAMVIITPVVYAMLMGAGHTVQVKDVAPGWYLWVWCGTLVLSTFLPLVIVAYVEVMRHGAGAAILPVDRTEAGIVTIDQPVIVQSDPVSRPPVPAKGEGAARMEELYDGGRGITAPKEMSTKAGVTYEAAKSWLRRNKVTA